MPAHLHPNAGVVVYGLAGVKFSAAFISATYITKRQGIPEKYPGENPDSGWSAHFKKNVFLSTSW
jgi:hypothetical protein